MESKCSQFRYTKLQLLVEFDIYILSIDETNFTIQDIILTLYV